MGIENTIGLTSNITFETGESLHRFKVLQEYADRQNLVPTPGLDLCAEGTDLSIVIPAYFEAGYIGNTLKIIQDDNSSKNAEIIVVDNGSRDRTKDVVTEVARQSSIPIVLLEEAKQGPGNARKRGMDEVIMQLLKKGKKSPHFIGMIDADTVPDHGWTDSIVAELSKSYVDALGGTYHFPDWVDEDIEKATGIEHLFGELSQIVHFMTLNGFTLPKTFGPNAAFNVAAYASINGSVQPVGIDATRDDWIMGDKMREQGLIVGYNPVQTIASPRRAILSIAKRADAAHFYTTGSKGEWTTIRGDARKILGVALNKLTVDQWLEERERREYYYALSSLIIPMLKDQINIEQLESVLGDQIIPVVEEISKTKELLDLTNRDQIDKVAEELCLKYSPVIFELTRNAMSNVKQVE